MISWVTMRRLAINNDRSSFNRNAMERIKFNRMSVETHPT